MPAVGDRFSTSQGRFGVDPAALVLIVATLIFSWLAMMIVHEFGHVLHAWLSGGKVTKVVLHPLAISRTDVDPNPHPQFVAWGGPIWGCLLPLVLALVSRFMRRSSWPILAFFAGFCLIANGAYLGVGAWDPVGDALELRMQGTHPWELALFGLVTIPIGFWLWHGLGRHFGLGIDRLPVKWGTALWMTALAWLIVVLECAISRRI